MAQANSAAPPQPPALNLENGRTERTLARLELLKARSEAPMFCIFIILFPVSQLASLAISLCPNTAFWVKITIAIMVDVLTLPIMFDMVMGYERLGDEINRIKGKRSRKCLRQGVVFVVCMALLGVAFGVLVKITYG